MKAAVVLVAVLMAAQAAPAPRHWAKGETIRVWIDTVDSPPNGETLVERAMRTWTTRGRGTLHAREAADRARGSRARALHGRRLPLRRHGAARGSTDRPHRPRGSRRGRRRRPHAARAQHHRLPDGAARARPRARPRSHGRHQHDHVSVSRTRRRRSLLRRVRETRALVRRHRIGAGDRSVARRCDRAEDAVRRPSSRADLQVRRRLHYFGRLTATRTR